MYYSIRHLTKFLYSNPVSESMMETRMHPRSDLNQRCHTFHLSVSPRCRVFSYRDHLANNVHHFDIPGMHGQLVIVAESLVEVQPAGKFQPSLRRTPGEIWILSFNKATTGRCCCPANSPFRRQNSTRSPNSSTFAAETIPHGLHNLNQQIYEYFDYKPKSTKVDSPIDLALGTKAGVCQDFAHIMIALVRSKLGIPCRYVSGYLFHGESDMDRSISSATHAWVEALLPQLGWVGFDPTNWLVAGDRHIRTAIGRDYADVPPTHGVFRGRASSELTVAVRVTASLRPHPSIRSCRYRKTGQRWLRRQPVYPNSRPATRQQQMAQQQQDGTNLIAK